MLESAVLNTVRLRLQPEFLSHSLRRHILWPNQGDHTLPAHRLESVIPAGAGSLRGVATPPKRPMNEIDHFLLFNATYLLNEQADLTHGLAGGPSQYHHRPWPCWA